MKEKLCERLKESRNKCGLSQTEVADYLKISRQSISQWETGKSYPDPFFGMLVPIAVAIWGKKIKRELN